MLVLPVLHITILLIHLFELAGDFDASWLSQSHMAASMQLAEEYAKEDKEIRATPEGLKNTSRTIESGE